MKRLHAFGLLLASLFTAAAAPGFDWAGTWRMDQPRAGGVTLRSYFVFTPKGAAMDGKLVINNSVDLPFLDPHFDHGDFVFGTTWNMSFRLHPEDDTLRVSVHHRSGAVDHAVARRTSPAEAQPPPAPPLPKLEKLRANGLAQTPPMGWNSWNHFADRVDDRIVREAADALVRTGLRDAGYVYINIDDAWESHRDAAGRIVPNSKFPDMKALADYVHARGLKLGLYSSPGARTCGGYEGSLGYEELDAKTYAAWGIDYLKYDWCSAARVYSDQDLRAAYQKMGRALLECGRPIVYSLCEYGMAEVWTWGPDVSANLWRTTGDIQDNWQSMSKIGFSQSRLSPYARPGHWNDPDMLEVGNGGMTTVEYRTHFSLWCMLAAPLIAGNDLTAMSTETFEILANREAIAVDQDRLGTQGIRLRSDGEMELWRKPLHDGVAVALFNRGATESTGRFTWKEVGVTTPPQHVRDLWRHEDVHVVDESFTSPIPAHGVVLLKVTAGK